MCHTETGSKCYSNIVAISDAGVADYDTSDEKWHTFCNFSGHLRIMIRYCHGVKAYAPLYRHTFRLLQPHKLTEAERFNIENHDPGNLTSISDKLRYYRYKKALNQREVADCAGIYRSTYIHYENGMETYPLDNLKKIAALLEIGITDLLDDYHLFLLRGQGEELKALRKQKALTQRRVAELAGVATGTVRRWESGDVTISRKNWELLFGNKAQG